MAQGLEQGLGREDIARDLAQAAKSILAGKSAHYWEIVSSAFIAQGRSFSQLSAFSEAGIERYVIEAVLDEHTSEICRFLHEKTFSVSDGLARFEAIENLDKPEDIKDFQPWVRERMDPQSGQKKLYVKRGNGLNPNRRGRSVGLWH